MSHKKRPGILVLVPFYLPGYKSGGPVRTIANLVDHLGQEFDFRVITSDRDATDEEPYPFVAVEQWNRVGGALVYYLRSQRRSYWQILSLISTTPFDLLYLNSFFSLPYTVLPLLARLFGLIKVRSIVIAPRGQFSRGALAIRLWVKRAFVLGSKAAGLYNDLLWQASSRFEAKDIQRVMRVCRRQIVVAPDLPPLGRPEVSSVAKKKPKRSDREPLRVCFLSRISPKKNLDFALEVVNRASCPLRFNIYGPIDDQRYWTKCQSIIKTLRASVAVRYHGAVPHDMVTETFRENDLFLFPTLGENYGHVIAEALCAGTPVLLSDTTPWRHLEGAGAGWVIPLSEIESFAEVIDRVAGASSAQFDQWRQAAASYGRRATASSAVVAANRRLFSSALRKARIQRRGLFCVD